MANPALEPAFLDAALGVARNAASAAAQVIRRYYRGQFETRSKDDASPVTQADVESESAIRAVLRIRTTPSTARSTGVMVRAISSGWSIRSTAPRVSCAAIRCFPPRSR